MTTKDKLILLADTRDDKGFIVSFINTEIMRIVMEQASRFYCSNCNKELFGIDNCCQSFDTTLNIIFNDGSEIVWMNPRQSAFAGHIL